MAKKSSKREPEKKAPARRGEPVYTMMAFITLVAMILGCVLLYLDYDEYGKQSPPKETAPTLKPLGGEDVASPPKGL